MDRQIDGVAMGSPLGPALANTFVGYYESKLFNKISIPTVYCCYVNDTFSLFHKVTSYMNTCATAIVGTWVKRLNVCRTESASMCRSLFGTEPVKNVNNQNAQEN